MINIGENIRNARKAKGLTLKGVCLLTGLSISFLSDIERGRTSPSLRSLIKIAECLETDVRSLIDGTVSISPLLMEMKTSTFDHPQPFKCPVCDGSGLVSRPPWIAGDIFTWTLDSANINFKCKTCNGTGVIWSHQMTIVSE